MPARERVAQLVEHLTFNQGVMGSSPIALTNPANVLGGILNIGVVGNKKYTAGIPAQGTSPASPTIKDAVKGLYAFAKCVKEHGGQVSPDDLKVLKEAKKQADEAYKTLVSRPHSKG